MPKLKPCFHVVAPCEDLRDDKPLDPSEFAVNLEDILRCHSISVDRDRSGQDTSS